MRGRVKVLCVLGAALTVAGAAPAQTPLVTTAATVDTTAEGGSTPGEITIYRGGPTAGELTIDFSLGGTAAGGIDYTLSSAADLTGPYPYHIVIPDGAASVTVDITPIDRDVQSIPFLTVTVTILPSGAYIVGTPADATVTILDDDIYIAAFNLVVPADFAVIEVDAVNTFTWESAEGSAQIDLYALVVATDPAFTENVQLFNGGTNTSVAVLARTFGYLTEYHWKVTAYATEGGGTTRDSENTYTFTTLTDTKPPTIVRTTPADGQNAFNMLEMIEITFSEPMDETSTLAAFSIVDSYGNPVTGMTVLNLSGRRLIFMPTGGLGHGAAYTVKIAATATDTALVPNTLDGDFDGTAEGSPEDDYTFSFRTPAVTPFAGGCRAGRVDTAGWMLALAAALGVLGCLHGPLGRETR